MSLKTPVPGVKSDSRTVIRLQSRQLRYFRVITLDSPGIKQRLCHVKCEDCPSIKLHNCIDRLSDYTAEKSFSQWWSPEMVCKPYDLQKPQSQKTVEIFQIHLEQDSCRSLHNKLESLSQIDLNRAGSDDVFEHPPLKIFEVIFFLRIVQSRVAVGIRHIIERLHTKNELVDAQ